MLNRFPTGALTAIITPFTNEGRIDSEALNRLVDFQIHQGISGIVSAGTTGETSAMTPSEHCSILSGAMAWMKRTPIFFGCGSNSTDEAMEYVEIVARNGGKYVLLVDPYYNGPSSLEIRREYLAPIAKRFPNVSIISYVVPARTGCALLPEDLAALENEFPGRFAVKEATGDLERMALTRKLTHTDFPIYCGDDGKTFDTMARPDILSCGIISVVSNIAPRAVQEMCQAILAGGPQTAETIRTKLQPLFDIVTVSAPRTAFGTRVVVDKFRNPLPIKTAMSILGMPAGPCRQPLGKMTIAGATKVRAALETVWERNPEVLLPVQNFFGVNIGERLEDDEILASLTY